MIPMSSTRMAQNARAAMVSKRTPRRWLGAFSRRSLIKRLAGWRSTVACGETANWVADDVETFAPGSAGAAALVCPNKLRAVAHRSKPANRTAHRRTAGVCKSARVPALLDKFSIRKKSVSAGGYPQAFRARRQCHNGPGVMAGAALLRGRVVRPDCSTSAAPMRPHTPHASQSSTGARENTPIPIPGPNVNPSAHMSPNTPM